MSKNWTWKTTRVSCDQKLPCFDNLVKNTWNKIVKYDKTGQEKKSFVSIFSSFSTAIAKV